MALNLAPLKRCTYLSHVCGFLRISPFPLFHAERSISITWIWAEVYRRHTEYLIAQLSFVNAPARVRYNFLNWQLWVMMSWGKSPSFVTFNAEHIGKKHLHSAYFHRALDHDTGICLFRWYEGRIYLLLCSDSVEAVLTAHWECLQCEEWELGGRFVWPGGDRWILIADTQ